MDEQELELTPEEQRDLERRLERLMRDVNPTEQPDETRELDERKSKYFGLP